MSDDPQVPLPLPSYIHRANAVGRKASKARRRLPVLQPSLPVPDSGYTPLAGVPRTRGDCPVVRPCPYVRCRFSLFLVDADTRAGRPGLSSVPRDEKGLTLPAEGNAGTTRAGTTLRPGWLKVNGLEIEREVRVWLHRNDDGELSINEARHGTLDYWLAHLRDGEPLIVFDGDTGQVMAKGTMSARGLELDREVPGEMFLAVLTRVREVSSCALDLIDRNGKMGNEQIGDAFALHRTSIPPVVRKAGAKLVAKGVDLHDLVEL